MKTILVGGSLALASSALAFSNVGVFSGSLNDNFESYPDYNNGGTYTSMAVMGGAATFTGNPDGSPGMWVVNVNTTFWGLGGNGSGGANSGVQSLGFYDGGIGPTITLTFANAVTDFGGYWQTCDSNYGNVNVSFYDAGNNLIGTDSWVQAGNAFQWRGWSDAGGIKTMVLTGNSAPIVDDITANGAVPEPASMAALGLGIATLIRRRAKKA
ncbi:MAG: PEP-CTERM sorting domain-containing protein [Armatimonadetes bacterium]|nr:PEP-CTERM sorting domain-containing protein [Armatimonadota bacterium]